MERTMKKIMLATAAAAALLTGAASWQPAEAQVRYASGYNHGYYGGGWGWNNPVAVGAGAIVGTAAAIATAPLWAATGGYGYGYDYGYAPAIYASGPVVYRTRIAPRRVVYRTRYVEPRRIVHRGVIRAD